MSDFPTFEEWIKPVHEGIAAMNKPFSSRHYGLSLSSWRRLYDEMRDRHWGLQPMPLSPKAADTVLEPPLQVPPFSTKRVKSTG